MRDFFSDIFFRIEQAYLNWRHSTQPWQIEELWRSIEHDRLHPEGRISWEDAKAQIENRIRS